MNDYLSRSYEDGRIFADTPLEQVAYALNVLVRDYSSGLDSVRNFSFNQLSLKVAQEFRSIGADFSELELYLDEVTPRLLQASNETRGGVKPETTERFLRLQAELRAQLQAERAKVTPLKLLLQEHFITVAGVVWDGIVGSVTRKNVNFLEEPFCDLARARDKLFHEWSSENFRSYLELSDRLMAMERYDIWRFHAEREFYDADHEFPTLGEIQALREDLEIEELWRARNEP